MKRPAPLVLVLALLASLSACTETGSDEGGSSAESNASAGAVAAPEGAQIDVAADLSSLPENASLLFVLQAESGDLAAVEGADLEYTLTLGHAASQTTWFTDRPLRDGGTVSTEAVISGWARLGFEEVPPNAVLTVAGRESADPLIVELGSPTYERDERLMRVPVTVLGRTRPDGIEGPFGAASLFIDNATVTNGCGYTGEIDFFPKSVTPVGYVPADGRSLPQSEFADLYAVVQDRFGSDGEQFAMPTVAGPDPDLHALVCAFGADPAETDPDEQLAKGCFIGRVQMFAQETPVYGHVLAAGQLLPITRHSWLYGYSGNRFGGDGVATFGVPNIASPPGTSQQVCASNVNNWSQNESVGMCYRSEVGFWAIKDGMPANWMPATGFLLPIAQNTALFGLLGTTFGGDGKVTFALPDLDLPAPNLKPGICGHGQYPPPS